MQLYSRNEQKNTCVGARVRSSTQEHYCEAECHSDARYEFVLRVQDVSAWVRGSVLGGQPLTCHKQEAITKMRSKCSVLNVFIPFCVSRCVVRNGEGERRIFSLKKKTLTALSLLPLRSLPLFQYQCLLEKFKVATISSVTVGR